MIRSKTSNGIRPMKYGNVGEKNDTCRSASERGLVEASQEPRPQRSQTFLTMIEAVGRLRLNHVPVCLFRF